MCPVQHLQIARSLATIGSPKADLPRITEAPIRESSPPSSGK
jgi:hypothetical protein